MRQSFREGRPSRGVIGICFHRFGKVCDAGADAVRRGELPVVAALQVSVAAFFPLRLPAGDDTLPDRGGEIAHQLQAQLIDGGQILQAAIHGL